MELQYFKNKLRKGYISSEGKIVLPAKFNYLYIQCGYFTVTDYNTDLYGLYDSDELIGMSLGYIKHWYTGTEYYIDELCIRTDRQGVGAGTFFLSEIEKAIKELGLKQIFLQTEAHVPAYEFYKKNGYIELEGHVSFAKEL